MTDPILKGLMIAGGMILGRKYLSGFEERPAWNGHIGNEAVLGMASAHADPYEDLAHVIYHQGTMREQ